MTTYDTAFPRLRTLRASLWHSAHPRAAGAVCALGGDFGAAMLRLEAADGLWDDPPTAVVAAAEGLGVLLERGVYPSQHLRLDAAYHILRGDAAMARRALDAGAKYGGTAGRATAAADEEALVEAALAAGLTLVGYARIRTAQGLEVSWNPLMDDGDALRLAVALFERHGFHRITWDMCARGFRVFADASEGHGASTEAMTRRAIVSAAQAIMAKLTADLA